MSTTGSSASTTGSSASITGSSTSTVAFATLGCRLNQVDSQDLAARLEQRGVRTVDFGRGSAAPPDVVVVNTCTVTGRADVSDRQMIRRATRRHPGARVVVTGCWAQTDPGAVASLRGVDVVVGNADKARLPEIVAALLSEDAARRRATGQGPWASGSCREQASPAPDVQCRPTTPGPSPTFTLPPALAALDVSGDTTYSSEARGDVFGGATSLSQARVDVSDIAACTTMPVPVAPRWRARSRVFIKVQEGCQHRCAFCIVPRARGVSRSLAPAVAVEHARRLVALGHPEIVLTGVDLGHYGADLRARGADLRAGDSLASLVRELGAIPGVRWLRLSSVLPAYFTPELLDVVTTSPVVAPHLHIPLQSGSDRVLRRMRRPYNVTMYRRLVERLAAGIPRLGLGADVIVGFPGEMDDDFAATMALVDTLPFSYLHVFGYSDRKDTEAAALPDRVPAETIARRSRALRALADAKNLAFRSTMADTIQDVLVLEARDRAIGDLVGLTGNYVEVTFAGSDALMGRMARVRITSVSGAATRGELSER